MKHPNFCSAGFTLVEMLVVVAIMSMLALVTIKSVNGAMRQARATKCQSHLRNLMEGVQNYVVEYGVYPCAGSYEDVWKCDSGNVYYELRGWVGWVRTDGKSSLRKESAWTYSGDGRSGSSDKSYASEYEYVGVGQGSDQKSENVRRSIREGSIFKYVNKDFSTYECSEFNGGKGAARAYAMNKFFSNRLSKDRWQKDASKMQDKNLSALAVFVECPAAGQSCTGVHGQSADGEADTKVYFDDTVWDWEKEHEPFGAYHRKNGKLYGNIAFADGHVEAVLGSLATDTEYTDKIGKGVVE